MDIGGNSSFPSPPGNSSSPTPKNNNNNSSSSTNVDSSSKSSVSDFILIPLLCLTIIFAVAYIILILIRPTFRANRLNWFTINVCLTTIVLSIFMLLMSITKIMNISSVLPCRVQGFLPAMAACQMMYSHAVVAVSRFLTIVYPNKRTFSSVICILGFIGFGWFVALLLSVAYLAGDGYACSSSTRLAFLPYYNLSVIVIIPVMIVLICNIRILIYVRRSSQRVRAEDRGNNVSQARDVRLIKTMIITFTVFVAGWVPLFVEQTFSEFISVSSTVDTIFQVLPPLSMLCDVILLIYTNQPVRIYIWQLIARRNRVTPNNTLANTVKPKPHTIQNH